MSGDVSFHKCGGITMDSGAAQAPDHPTTGTVCSAARWLKLVNCSVMGENLRANSNIDHGAKEKDYLRLRLSRPKCKSVMMIREKKRPDFSQKKEGIMSGFELVTCAFGS